MEIKVVIFSLHIYTSNFLSVVSAPKTYSLLSTDQMRRRDSILVYAEIGTDVVVFCTWIVTCGRLLLNNLRMSSFRTWTPGDAENKKLKLIWLRCLNRICRFKGGYDRFLGENYCFCL